MLKKTAKHSFVHDIRIATPCRADWDKMTGDERKRYCKQCNLNVYNIAELTLQEAEDLITSGNGGRVCVRLYRRRDGTVITRDCPVGVARLHNRIAALTGAFAAIGSMLAVWFGLKPPIAQHTMGAVVSPGILPLPRALQGGEDGIRHDTAKNPPQLRGETNGTIAPVEPEDVPGTGMSRVQSSAAHTGWSDQDKPFAVFEGSNSER